jgi:hypothetical protein
VLVQGRWGMGLGSGSCFNEPQPQVFQDGLDDLPVLNETDDPHGSPTPFDRLRTSFRAGQGINLPRSSRGQAPIF